MAEACGGHPLADTMKICTAIGVSCRGRFGTRHDAIMESTRKRTTVEVMHSLRVDDLKAIAAKLGLPKTFTRKDQLTAALQAYLDSSLETVLGQLSLAERTFLAEAAHQRGCYAPAVFKAKHELKAPDLWPASRKASSPIQLLLFDDRESIDYCIPVDLVPRLRELLSKPPAAVVKVVETIPPTLPHPVFDREPPWPIQVFEGERSVWAELRRVLSLVQGGKVRVQEKSRRPTDATVRLIAKSLLLPDLNVELAAELRDEDTETAGPIRAHAWGVLVQQCGWCVPRAGTLTLTKAGKALLGRISPEAFRAGFEQFMRDDQFDELNRISHIRGQAGKAKRYLTQPSARREEIGKSMHGWPVGFWIAFDEAFRFIAASGHDLLVTDKSYGLYFEDPNYGSLGDDDGIERQYVRAFFMESLATLGLLDIAYVPPHGIWPELGDSWGAEGVEFCGRYDGLLYVRLTSLGAYCLGIHRDYEPPAAPRQNLLRVLPNREIAVSGGTQWSPADESHLALFAKPMSDYVWQLDAQQILAYAESGGAIEDVGQFLQQNTTEPLPQTVQVFLDDLTAKAKAVAGVEKAYLVEMKDHLIAARVASDTQAGKLCCLAGERHLAVPDKNLNSFRTALRRLGYVLPQ